MEKADIRNPYRLKRKRSSNDTNRDCDPSNDFPKGSACKHQSTTGTLMTNDGSTTGSSIKDNDIETTNDTITSHNNGPISHKSTNNQSKFNMSDLVVSASDKAGMDGIDRAAIDAIIEKESGNSLFMQQQKKRDEKVNQRISLMKEKVQAQLQHNIINNKNKMNDPNITWRSNLERQVDEEMMECLSSRPVRSCKVVVDMDMFYMACELLTRPDITSNTPACVGGTSMITTSNYAARRYGVRAAMPGYIGSALVHQLSKGCEQLIFCPLNFDLYREKSVLVRTVLSEYDPNLSAYSLDEAYMDMAPYLYCSLTHPSWAHEEISSYINRTTTESTAATKEEHGSSRDATVRQFQMIVEDSKSTRQASISSLESYYDQLLQYSSVECICRTEIILLEMRERVRSVTGGLTCSAGCAPNFLLAKIASDIKKPNGQCIVRSDHASIVQFLHPLSIRKVSGIGRVTEKILRAFDIVTVQQLYNERAMIRFLFDRNPSTSNFLIRASFGCSNNCSDSISSEEGTDTMCASNQQKGISRERTIPSGKTWAEINSKLEDIASLLSDDMQKKELSANTIYVKVKLHTFDLLSHGRTLPRGVYIHTANDLIQIATELLHEIRQNEIISKKQAVGTNVDPTSMDDSKIIIRQLFSVRLLGIRCTNFKTHQSTVGFGGSDSNVVKTGRTQKTIDQYLVVSTNQKNIDTIRKESNAVTSFATSVAVNNPTGSLEVPVDTLSNPYKSISAVPSPQHPILLRSGAEVNHNGSVIERVVPMCTTSDCIENKTNTHSTTAPPTNGSSDSSNEYVSCPICNVRIFNHHHQHSNMNDLLNRHIDICLNGNTVQCIVREMNDQLQQQQQQRTKSKGYFFQKQTNTQRTSNK